MAGSKESEGDENGARPPPFVIYRNRLYVLSKKPPPLNHVEGEGERSTLREEARLAGRPGPSAVAPPRTQRRVRRVAGPRPYIKGCFRHYERPHPHLRPAPARRRVRRRAPRSTG